MFRLTHKAASLARVLSTLLLASQRTPRVGSGRVNGHVVKAELLNLQKSGQFPDDPVRITV
jgi:hypothetical protein